MCVVFLKILTAEEPSQAIVPPKPRSTFQPQPPSPMRTLKLFLLCLLTAAVCQTARAGMAVRLWYSADGTSVSAITSLPGFPNAINPAIYYGYDDVLGGIQPELTYLTTILGDNTSYLNNYGTYIRGWVEAPMDGSYRFFIYSDDNSEL